MDEQEITSDKEEKESLEMMEDYNPMRASLTQRNYEAYKKLDEVKQAHRALKDKPVPFPVYKTADNIVNNLGWRNFLRSFIKESREVMKQLKP